MNFKIQIIQNLRHTLSNHKEKRIEFALKLP